VDSSPPRLVFTSENPFIRLYHGNCLELLDAIAAKYPEGRFDAIFADLPYFLSNGGIHHTVPVQINAPLNPHLFTALEAGDGQRDEAGIGLADDTAGLTAIVTGNGPASALPAQISANSAQTTKCVLIFMVSFSKRSLFPINSTD
jgi:hypothetical protein